MRTFRHLSFLCAIFAVAILITPTASADVSCGREGEPPCWSLSNLINTGTPFAEGTRLCPKDTFFDLIDNGTCWSCPQDYVRTWDSVKTQTACVRHAREAFSSASRHAASNIFSGCPKGQFFDVGNGRCWSCPSGYGRTGHPVTGARACAKTIAKNLSPAAYRGKAHWGCQDGLRDIRGTCRKTGQCGAKDQRPCEVDEQIPSCNSRLREDFKQNICVPLKPGESPFFAGLGSLSDFYGDAVKQYCRSWLSSAVDELDSSVDLGTGPRCGADIFVGFSCALLGDVATSYTGKVGAVANLPGQISELTIELTSAVDKAYVSEACLEHEEHFDPATQHGKAKGLSCPSGQFWDPNGSCWSCPKDSTRTFYPVTGPRACVNKFGGELLRSSCALWTGVQNLVAGPLECTVETLENGHLFQQPLDFQTATNEACMATGELGFTILALGADIGTAAATGDVTSILSAIARVKDGAVQGAEVKRLLECRREM